MFTSVSSTMVGHLYVWQFQVNQTSRQWLPQGRSHRLTSLQQSFQFWWMQSWNLELWSAHRPQPPLEHQPQARLEHCGTPSETASSLKLADLASVWSWAAATFAPGSACGTAAQLSQQGLWVSSSCSVAEACQQLLRSCKVHRDSWFSQELLPCDVSFSEAQPLSLPFSLPGHGVSSLWHPILAGRAFSGMNWQAMLKLWRQTAYLPQTGKQEMMKWPCSCSAYSALTGGEQMHSCTWIDWSPSHQSNPHQTSWSAYNGQACAEEQHLEWHGTCL